MCYVSNYSQLKLALYFYNCKKYHKLGIEPTSTEGERREVVLVYRRAGRVVCRHSKRVPGLRQQVQDRKQVGPRVPGSKVLNAWLDIVVDQDPVCRFIVVGIGQRGNRDSNAVLDDKAGDRAASVLPLCQVEDDGGRVDPEEVPARGRGDRGRALCSSRDGLGAFADAEVIACL